MKKHIQRKIEELVNTLKPEIRDKAVFIFSDEKIILSDKVVLANNNNTFEPPVITIFVKAINDMFTVELQKIIAHEIIHCFTRKEEEAYQRQGKTSLWV